MAVRLEMITLADTVAATIKKLNQVFPANRGCYLPL